MWGGTFSCVATSNTRSRVVKGPDRARSEAVATPSHQYIASFMARYIHKMLAARETFVFLNTKGKSVRLFGGKDREYILVQ